jgi:cell division protein FtsI (penicillin-binding protein 3)
MRDKREKWARVRIRIIGSFFAVFFAIVGVRAFYLQIIKEGEWIKRAERQHRKVVPLTPARGTIYDSTGSSMAVSIEMDSCFAEPDRIQNVGDAATKLSPILRIAREQLVQKLNGNRHFVWLQRQMTPDLVRKIKDLDIKGIEFVKETKRFYPNSEVAAHVIGFTGRDPEGLEGIELKFNSLILGSTGYLVTERDALGRDIGLNGQIVKKSSKGSNVVLTLDKNIQYIAEKELAKAVTECRANCGMALVMEPQTGKILAMANYPNFNPNSFQQYPMQSLRNRVVADSFEPGSTLKVFLVAAALEEKVVSPNDSINCENGSYSIGGRTIHDTHKHGTLKISEILKYSSNIGAAKIGSRLGQQKLYSYLNNFGFGTRTGIELPGEVAGLLKDRKQWYGIDLATISFGQGISISAVQLATAISAVANGGLLMKPYIVDRVTDDNGNVLQQFSPQTRRRVISQHTANALTRMMEGVTDEGGTGIKASVEGYDVAGKTGTAQKVDSLTRAYSASKRTASFVGFVPAAHPRLTIVVVIDEPKTNSYGGIVAAPAFSEIALQTLCYLRVMPTKTVKKKEKGSVEAKTPDKDTTPVVADEAVFDEWGGGSTMPNFKGMSMRQVLRVMGKSDLNVKLIGSGRAVEQNPQPGKKIGPSDQVWVKFLPSA